MGWGSERGSEQGPGVGLVEAGEDLAPPPLLQASLTTGRADTTRASETRTLKDTKLEVNIIALNIRYSSLVFRILTQHVIAEGL